MTRLRLPTLRQMKRYRGPSFPGSASEMGKRCAWATQHPWQSAAAVVLTLSVMIFVGCGASHYALEEDKPKTAEEKAIGYLKSKGVRFERVDPKYVKGVKEPYWRVHLNFSVAPDLGFMRMTDADLEYLKKIEGVKYIEIGKQFSDKGLATIAELKQLTELVVYDLPKVTDRGIEKIADIATLERLSLGKLPNVSDRGIDHIADMATLERLDLGYLDVTDAAFKRFGRLRLKRLTLGALPNVTDRGIDYIADIATLEHLTLIRLNVTDRAFRRFGRLQKLKSLDLAGIFSGHALSVSDEALKSLKPMKRLEELKLGGTRVTDAGCAALAELPALKVLNLLGAKKITEAGCASLAAAPALKELSLGGTIFGNEAVKSLSKSKSLEVLSLGGTGIDDGAMKFIPDFKKLRRLTIGFMITDEGLKHLRKARLTSLDLYSITLTIKSEKITDRGLRYLQEMKTLKRLRFVMPGTGITEQGLNRLRKARPDLRLLDLRPTK